MSKIATEYNKDEILQRRAAQIPWYSLVEITMKSKTHEEMLWYINEAHKILEELPEYLEKRLNENNNYPL